MQYHRFRYQLRHLIGRIVRRHRFGAWLRLCWAIDALNVRRRGRPALGAFYPNLEKNMATSVSRILDLLVEAVKRYKQEGNRGIDWTFDHMTQDERLAFDLFLVRMNDPLAYEAGTCEYRFRTRVLRMANPA